MKTIQEYVKELRASAGKRRSVVFPAGVISTAGRDRITNYLADWGLAALPSDWSWSWEAVPGDRYSGNFSKRVAKYQREMGHTTGENQRARIGDLASSCVNKEGRTFHFEIAEKMDWQSGDFQDYGSCFFTCRNAVRAVIAENTGMFMKLYSGPDEDADRLGRCILDVAPDRLMTWNGYGELSALQAARILAADAASDFTFSQVWMNCNGRADGLVWINGEQGYVVGPKEQVAECRVESQDLLYKFSQCCHCERVWTPGCGDPEQVRIGDLDVCNDCLERYNTCDDCHCLLPPHSGTSVGDSMYCSSCVEKHAERCDYCGCWCKIGDTYRVGDRNLCDHCVTNNTFICQECKMPHLLGSRVFSTSRGYMCQGCWTDSTACCNVCNERIDIQHLTDGRCGHCIENRRNLAAAATATF